MKKIIPLFLFTIIFVVGCSQSDETITKGTASLGVPALGFEDVEEMVVVDTGGESQSPESGVIGEVTGEATEREVKGEVKEFKITAKQWSFDPDTIIVNKGDIVKITIKSLDVTHGFNLPDFGVSKTLEPGKTVNIEFVADKTGTFNFWCHIPCGRGHGGMNGKLIVQ